MSLLRPSILVVLSLSPTVPALAQDALGLDVDAREAPRRIVHVQERVPARPGPMALVYPKWIPGEHSPTGPITDLVGLRIQANGKNLTWLRDPADMFRFQVEVPAGASALEVSFDFVSPPVTQGFSSGAAMTPNVAIVAWNQVVLYPDGAASDAVQVKPRLQLPEGWAFATALTVTARPGSAVEFAPVSLTKLVDSPVLAGRHLRMIDLAPGKTPAVRLNLAGESEEAVQIGRYEERFVHLAAEAAALFGGQHYDHYDFLYALSDDVAHFGLEHHESSDNRTDERTFLDEELQKTRVGLLPHEYVHSWNGKYRRPADLATSDYQKPMRSGLLWVYEGLTNYLGAVLTARSGLLTLEQSREDLARVAAYLDHRPGREWRPLVDTAVAAQLLYGARHDWASWRREVDYYDEGTLIWLEADTLIRQHTGNRSLDDFCKKFHGAPSGGAEVKTYTLDDVVAALNDVFPYAWKSHLESRVNSTGSKAPLGGIENSGWRLVYVDKAPDTLAAREQARKMVDLTTSIGLVAQEDGSLMDVIPGMAAAKAGVAPGMKIVAVNGRRFTCKVMRAALAAGKGRPDPLELIVQNGDFMSVHKLDYHDGERWPALERDPTQPDLLTAILSPRTWKPAPAAAATPAPASAKKSEKERERERESKKERE
jgi:predicted metalloprotease with PDZ domain